MKNISINSLIIFYIILNIFTLDLYSNELEIVIKENHFIKDIEVNIIVCNQDISEYSEISDINELFINLNGEKLEFTNIPDKLEIGTEYIVKKGSSRYKLFFSELPFVFVDSKSKILDEPKVYAEFVLTEQNGSKFSSKIGIEYRGGYSLNFPKKSYGFELWKDNKGDETSKESLLGLRKDDDWILMAMFNEPLRLRNVVCHKLWQKINKLSYQDLEEKAVSGVRTKYVELSINHTYQGIYALGERIDRKQLSLKKFKDGKIHGELYKGIGWGKVPLYSENYINYDNSKRIWDNMEMIYPDDDEITDWSKYATFLKFIVQSPPDEFIANFNYYFEYKNAIDYYLFLNLIRATDNTGKNIFVAKYDIGEPYFNVPWDMDGAFGMMWNGDKDSVITDMLRNGMYWRLLYTPNSSFLEDAKNRWFELRNTHFSQTNLMDMFRSEYNKLHYNGIYKRELIKWDTARFWGTTNFVDTNNLEYTVRWLNGRLYYMDKWFDPTNVNESQNNTIQYSIFPNPASTSIFLYSNDNTPFEYSISNISGMEILHAQINDAKTRIDLTSLNKGVYFIRFKNSITNQISIQKFIKL